jgi:hypothetical protein
LGGDPAEVFQFREEPLDQVAFAIEPLAEAGFPLPIRFCRNIWRSTLLLDQCADAVSIIFALGYRWRIVLDVDKAGRTVAQVGMVNKRKVPEAEVASDIRHED